jgi:hypothetical protein
MLPAAKSPLLPLWLAPVAAARSASFLVRLGDRAGWHLRHPGTVPETMRLRPQLPGRPARQPTEPLGEEGREKDTATRHLDPLEHLEPV